MTTHVKSYELYRQSRIRNDNNSGVIMSTAETPTPRTDKETREEYDSEGCGFECVEPDFARQLERELAAKSAELESCKKDNSLLLEFCRAVIAVRTDDSFDRLTGDEIEELMVKMDLLQPKIIDMLASKSARKEPTI